MQREATSHGSPDLRALAPMLLTEVPRPFTREGCDLPGFFANGSWEDGSSTARSP